MFSIPEVSLELSTTRENLTNEDIRASYKASLLRFRGIQWDNETKEAVQCFVDINLKAPLFLKQAMVVLEVNGFKFPRNTVLRIFRKVKRAMAAVGCVPCRKKCSSNTTQWTASPSPEEAAMRREKFIASLSSFRKCSGRRWTAEEMDSLKCFHNVDAKPTPSVKEISDVLNTFGYELDQQCVFSIYSKIKAAMKYLRKST